jgi:type IV secretory pathway TrbF-like protein
MTFSARRLDTGSSVPVETPYQRAKQVWDNRIGDAYAHARNWRLMAFCMAGISCIFAAGFDLTGSFCTKRNVRTRFGKEFLSCRRRDLARSRS